MTDPRNKNRQASKVNTAPRGLQSFAGNVNQGINPHELNHEVQPGVDLIPFWGVDKMRTEQAGGNIPGVIGQGVDMTVPQGEVWLPIAVSGQYFVPTESNRTISIRLVDPSGGLLVFLAQKSLATSGFVGEVAASMVFPTRFIMPSDWGFRCEVDFSNNATASGMEINLTYIKLTA